MQARRQQRDLVRNDTQLTLLGFPRVPLNSNYVSPSQFVIDMNKFFF